jgi:hypothetical protein
MDITESPGTPEPEAIHAMVVYDPSTGIILHGHIAVHYPGGRVQERHELERDDFRLACSLPLGSSFHIPEV